VLDIVSGLIRNSRNVNLSHFRVFFEWHFQEFNTSSRNGGVFANLSFSIIPRNSIKVAPEVRKEPVYQSIFPRKDTWVLMCFFKFERVAAVFSFQFPQMGYGPSPITKKFF